MSAQTVPYHRRTFADDSPIRALGVLLITGLTWPLVLVLVAVDEKSLSRAEAGATLAVGIGMGLFVYGSVLELAGVLPYESLALMTPLGAVLAVSGLLVPVPGGEADGAA